ncbi:MAG: hypothetical protein ACWGNV_02455 [Bacteroidales bacterium]
MRPDNNPARLLYYAGFRSVEALAAELEEALVEKLNQAGKAYPEETASWPEEDLRRCLQQVKAICQSDRENKY